MQSRRKLMQKTLAFIAVFVLIVMMLPTAAFAAGNGKGNSNNLPEQASDNARKVHAEKADKVKGEDDLEDLDLDDGETEEDPEEMSEWAMYVQARNYWAKNTAMIAPGHANLLDKLLAKDHTMPMPLPDSILSPVDTRIAMLNTLYMDNFAADAALGVKAFMSKIKGVRTGEIVLGAIS